MNLNDIRELGILAKWLDSDRDGVDALLGTMTTAQIHTFWRTLIMLVGHISAGYLPDTPGSPTDG